MQLTPRSLQVLRVIDRAVARDGYPPTVREIGAAVGLSSPSTVHAHLSTLRRAGCIEVVPEAKRAMSVTLLGRSVLNGERVAA
jgi:repressor LexA